MRLLALSVATATVLALALPQTPPVLAQSRDDGAVGPTLRLDGGPPLGTDNRETGARSERTEPSTGAGPEKGQTGIEKTDETIIRGRSHTHVGWNSRAKPRFVIHRRAHHIFAFHAPRRPFAIHRHGRRFVAFNEPSSV
jgi:hypothetical protein